MSQCSHKQLLEVYNILFIHFLYPMISILTLDVGSSNNFFWKCTLKNIEQCTMNILGFKSVHLKFCSNKLETFLKIKNCIIWWLVLKMKSASYQECYFLAIFTASINLKLATLGIKNIHSVQLHKCCCHNCSQNATNTNWFRYSWLLDVVSSIIYFWKSK